MIEAGHIIDGQEVPSVAGGKFVSINPATEEPLAEVAEGGAKDVDRAVKAARRAFDDGRAARAGADTCATSGPSDPKAVAPSNLNASARHTLGRSSSFVCGCRGPARRRRMLRNLRAGGEPR